MGTTDSLPELFGALSERGHEPLLRKVNGKVLFEVRSGRRVEPWLLTIDGGAIEVARRTGQADATLRADKAVFDGLARGEVNAVTAMLRGELMADGDRRLLVLVQRLLPAPSRRLSRKLIKASGRR